MIDAEKKRILKIVILVLPLLIGTAGLIWAGLRPLHALFSSLTMYVLNYGEDASNWLVELARWTAPLVTAGSVALMFKPVAYALRARFLLLRGKSVAVYGDRDLYRRIRREKRYRAIEGEDRFLPASIYLFFGDEQENLDAYRRYKDRLEGKEVYLKCGSLRSQTSGLNLHLFSAEETGARLFWKQAGMYEQFLEKNGPLTIAMIGFGRLGEELLLWGLQNNIFAPGQKIRYEIYGDGERFLSLHRELASLEDEIVFPEGTWRSYLDSLESADRILVCEQEGQLQLVQDLLFALTGKELDLLAADTELLSMLEDRSRIRAFAWKEAAMKPENIFDEETARRAKAINLRYASIYKGVAETPENAEKEWAKLDAFTRYSNISSADYHEIRRQMLASWGVTNADGLDQDQLETLAELEHMRWCRFHWLNNWRYGPEVGGKAKDPDKRTHYDLRPFKDLPDSERQKDRDTVGVLMGLD